MPAHPAALVPPLAASAELRRLAVELGVVVDGVDAGRLPDGTRTVVVAEPESVRVGRFPAFVEDGNLTLPGLTVDFFDWFYVEPQVIANVPTSGTWWLRMVIGASCTNTGALSTSAPVACTIGDPSFEWWEESLPIPSNEAGGVAGVEYDYYFYLVQVTDGIITNRAYSTYIVDQPVATPS